MDARCVQHLVPLHSRQSLSQMPGRSFLNMSFTRAPVHEYVPMMKHAQCKSATSPSLTCPTKKQGDLCLSHRVHSPTIVLTCGNVFSSQSRINAWSAYKSRGMRLSREKKKQLRKFLIPSSLNHVTIARSFITQFSYLMIIYYTLQVIVKYLDCEMIDQNNSGDQAAFLSSFETLSKVNVRRIITY